MTGESPRSERKNGMKKIVVIPDSFKGSFSAAEFCRIAEKEIHGIFPACRVLKIPAADGGERTVGAFLTALGGEWVAVPVRGPLGEEVPASFGVLPDGTAVIEAAAVFGPQKGADPRIVGILDAGLRNLASAAARKLGRDLLRLPGVNRAYRSCAFPLAPQPL